MDEKVKEHLQNALEAYTNQLEQVTQFVDGMKPQLAKAEEHRTKLESMVTNAKEILGITDEGTETETEDTSMTDEETETANLETPETETVSS